MSRKAVNNQTSFGWRSRLTVTFTLWGGLLLATGLSACVRKRSPAPPKDPLGTLEPISEGLQVDFFFDATLSMKGFVTAHTASSYQSLVPMLERGVIEGW